MRINDFISLKESWLPVPLNGEFCGMKSVIWRFDNNWVFTMTGTDIDGVEIDIWDTVRKEANERHTIEPKDFKRIRDMLKRVSKYLPVNKK